MLKISKDPFLIEITGDPPVCDIHQQANTISDDKVSVIPHT
jgi:hypothetical protein